MDGAFHGDFQKPLPLLFRDGAPDGDAARDRFQPSFFFRTINAILAVSMLVVEFDADSFDGDFLPFGIHEERHCSARAERAEEQIIGVGAESIAFPHWLVNNEGMRVCDDLVLKIL
jgi:hypothetical protein